MAEAESHHQHAVQDLARASMEQVQNVSARVASDVRTEALAEAESPPTIFEGNRRTSQ